MRSFKDIEAESKRQYLEGSLVTYLARYLSGDYEQVWDELFSLGPTVFTAPLHDDALAVVRETMRRVRFNIEELILRLTRLGFVFGYDHRIRYAFTDHPYHAATWRDYLEFREWAYHQPPVFLPASLHEEAYDEIVSWGLADVADDVLDGIESIPTQKANVHRLEQEIGPIPLTVRAWYEQIGAVNFYGYFDGWLKYVELPTHLMTYCDPLQVAVLDSSFVDQLVQINRPGQNQRLEFAADKHFKDHYAGSSTPHVIMWKEAGIDGELPPDPGRGMTFVKYLRLCFRWAGFPGMSTWTDVPQDDLTMLTEGLLPF